MEPASGITTSDKQKPATHRITSIILVSILALGLIAVFTQADQIRLAIQQANWEVLPAILAFTLIGYSAMGLAFAYISQMIGIRMSLRDLAEIGFVTNTINHLAAAGGVAGFSIRYILMNRHGTTMKEIIAASLLHFYLTSLDMIVMTPVSLGYLMIHADIPRGVSILLGSMTVILGIGAFLATILIFSQRFRAPILRSIAAVVKGITRRDMKPEMDRFNQTMGIGVRAMHNNPGVLGKVIALTILDWTASVIVLYFCLSAFGEPVAFGITVTGFVLGVVSGVLSMVPGGFGVQEGSMTAVLVLLGVPFEQAFLGAIFYRAVYYILPYLVSLGFYRHLMRTDSTSVA